MGRSGAASVAPARPASPRDGGIGATSGAIRAQVAARAAEDGQSLSRTAAMRSRGAGSPLDGTLSHRAPGVPRAPRSGAALRQPAGPRMCLGADHNRSSWIGPLAAANVALEQEALAGRMRVVEGTIRVRGGTPPRERREREAGRRDEAAGQAPLSVWTVAPDDAARGAVAVPRARGSALDTGLGAGSVDGGSDCVGWERASDAASSARYSGEDDGDGERAARDRTVRLQRMAEAVTRATRDLDRGVRDAWGPRGDRRAAGSPPGSPSRAHGFGTEDRFASADRVFITRLHTSGQSHDHTSGATFASQAPVPLSTARRSPGAVFATGGPRLVPLSDVGVDSPGVGSHTGRVRGLFPPVAPDASDMPRLRAVPSVGRAGSPRGERGDGGGPSGDAASAVQAIRREARSRLRGGWSGPRRAGAGSGRDATGGRAGYDDVDGDGDGGGSSPVGAVGEAIASVRRRGEAEAARRASEQERAARVRAARAAAASRRREEEAASPRGQGERSPWRGDEAHDARVRRLEADLAALSDGAARSHAPREDASTVDRDFFATTNRLAVRTAGGVRAGVRPAKGPRAPSGFGSSSPRPVNARQRSALASSPSPLDHVPPATFPSALSGGGAADLARAPTVPRATRAQRARVFDPALHNADPLGAAAAQAAAESDAAAWGPASQLGSASDALLRPGPASYNVETADRAVAPRIRGSAFAGVGAGPARTVVRPSDTPGPASYGRPAPDGAEASLSGTRLSARSVRFGPAPTPHDRPRGEHGRSPASRRPGRPLGGGFAVSPVAPSSARPGARERPTTAGGLVPRTGPPEPGARPSTGRPRARGIVDGAAPAQSWSPRRAWAGPAGAGPRMARARAEYGGGTGRRGRGATARGADAAVLAAAAADDAAWAEVVPPGEAAVDDTGFRPSPVHGSAARRQPPAAAAPGDVGSRSHLSDAPSSRAAAFGRAPRFEASTFSPLSRRVV